MREKVKDRRRKERERKGATRCRFVWREIERCSFIISLFFYYLLLLNRIMCFGSLGGL